MTDLTWFQARDLALRKYAIRRVGWTYWLIYRAHTWIISEMVEGKEERRVVQATDFRDSEFLAKDWTVVPGEGMSIPPCSTFPLPTTALPATSSQAWTLTQFCGGDGQGGGVPPRGGPGITQPLPLMLEIAIWPATSGLGSLVPDGGGGTCWVGAVPAEYLFIMARPGPGLPASERGGTYCVYISEAGADLSETIPFGGAISGVGRQLFMAMGTGPGDAEAFWDTSWDGAGWPNGAGAATNGDPIAITAGATITARVDYISPTGRRYTEFTSLDVAEACP